MATRTYTYTFTGSEANNAIVLTDAFPAFTGAFTIAYAISPAPTGTINFKHNFTRAGGTPVCFAQAQAVSASNVSGSTPLTVGTPSASWTCLDWTTYQLQYVNQLAANRAGKTLTITISGANVPSAIPCQFGTRPAAGAPAVAFVTDATIAAACTLIGAPWLAVLFAPLIGYALDTGVLCGTGPPSMPAIGNDDLLGDLGSKIAALQATMWYSVCECAPGSPTPVPYPPPVLVQPPGWPASPTYSCDPANLCATLTLILKRLDQLSTTAAGTAQLVTAIQRYAVPFDYLTGAVHAGLSGAGSFAIVDLVGVRVDITSALPGRQLEGTPAYLWDVGWMSIGTSLGMLEERRITRDTQIWQPNAIQEATTFGYFFKTGMVATVTELKPEPF